MENTDKLTVDDWQMIVACLEEKVQALEDLGENKPALLLDQLNQILDKIS